MAVIRVLVKIWTIRNIIMRSWKENHQSIGKWNRVGRMAQWVTVLAALV